MVKFKEFRNHHEYAVEDALNWNRIPGIASNLNVYVESRTGKRKDLLFRERTLGRKFNSIYSVPFTDIK